jgi:hypothetical protein
MSINFNHPPRFVTLDVSKIRSHWCESLRSEISYKIELKIKLIKNDDDDDDDDNNSNNKHTSFKTVLLFGQGENLFVSLIFLCSCANLAYNT